MPNWYAPIANTDIYISIILLFVTSTYNKTNDRLTKQFNDASLKFIFNKIKCEEQCNYINIIKNHI